MRNFQISLPTPIQKGSLSVEEALARRRSTRNYRPEKLSLFQLSQILYAAQGLTKGRFRSAPSAGATYPLEVFALLGSPGVEGMEAGIYRYVPDNHSLNMQKTGNFLDELARAALNQSFIAQAPVNIIIAAVYERTSRVYGRRAEIYVPVEAGHVGQNICLQAEALGLGTVVIGAFRDGEVVRILGAEVKPISIMPIGKPR